LPSTARLTRRAAASSTSAQGNAVSIGTQRCPLGDKVRQPHQRRPAILRVFSAKPSAEQPSAARSVKFDRVEAGRLPRGVAGLTIKLICHLALTCFCRTFSVGRLKHLFVVETVRLDFFLQLESHPKYA
jgi:hypothetical protein